jgi:hypothetical protein
MLFHIRRFALFALQMEGVRLPTLVSFWVFLACAVVSAQQNAAPHASIAAAHDSAEGTSSVDASVEPSTVAVHASSENSAEAAAKDAAQNPVAATISIPFQNNTFFQFGAYKRRVNALEIEPVIPFRLSENWLLITRTIVPVIYVPQVSPVQDENAGIGNMNPQFYLSPAHTGKIIWGVGPQLSLPTASDKTLGVNKWGAGPAGVVLTRQGHWLYGTLINQLWTGGAGKQGHQDPMYPTVFHSLNQMTLNPFVYYNMKHGWYFVSSLIMTADWAAKSGDQWTVPVGGGAGRVFKVGTQMVNARMQFWKDVQQPTGAQSWTMQTQIQLLFPHK